MNHGLEKPSVTSSVLSSMAFHAELGDGLLLAGNDGIGVHDTNQTDEVSVVRGSCGIDGALPGIDEVASSHRIAIRPLRGRRRVLKV